MSLATNRPRLFVILSLFICLSLALIRAGARLVSASEPAPETSAVARTGQEGRREAAMKSAESFDRVKRGTAGGWEKQIEEAKERLCRMPRSVSPFGRDVQWSSLGPNGGAAIDPCAARFRLPFSVDESNVNQLLSGAVSHGGESLLASTINGVMRRDSDGTWRKLWSGGGGFVAFGGEDIATIYSAQAGLSLRKSVDGGRNFIDAMSGVEGDSLFIAPFAVDPTEPRRLWAGGQTLWRTEDGAAHWVRAGAPAAGTAESRISAIAVSPLNSAFVLAGTSEGFIHRTTDAWRSDANTPWPSTKPREGFVSSLSFDPHNPNIAYATYSSFGGAHVWRSDDGGATWAAMDGIGESRLPDLPVHTLAIDPADSSRLFIGTDLGIFFTDDGGRHWMWERGGLGAAVVESLAISDASELFAFTRTQGVWRVDLKTAMPQSPDQSCEYGLSQGLSVFEPAGGAGSVNVTVRGANCAWIAQSDLIWVKITAGATGTGNGKVEFTVDANTTSRGRLGRLRIAGRDFYVSQAAAGRSCYAPIKPGEVVNGALTDDDCTRPRDSVSNVFIDRYTFAAMAGDRVAITLTTASFPPDITIVGPGNFSASTLNDGSSSFTKRLPRTPGDFLSLPQPGVYTIEVAPWPFALDARGAYQLGLSLAPAYCTSYSLSSDRASFDAEGGSGVVQVITAGYCPWTAASGSDWAKITAGAQGGGSNPVAFSVAPNSGATSRITRLSIGGQSFTIEQAGVGGNCIPRQLKPYEPILGSLNRADCASSIPTGSPGAGYSAERYWFDAKAGQRIALHAVAITDRLVPQLNLRDQNGFGLGGNALRLPASGDYLTIPEDGRYVVEILQNTNVLQANEERLGDYWLSLLAPPAGCSYSITPSTRDFDSNGGTGSFNISTDSSCQWVVLNNSNWLNLAGPSRGAGSATIGFGVAFNSGENYRRATLNLNGEFVTVDQSGRNGECLPTRITPGQTINGSGAGFRGADCPSKYRIVFSSIVSAKKYVFAGKRGDQIAIDYRSGGQTQALTLFNPAGQMIVETSGRFPLEGYFTLPADGDYPIEVSSFYSDPFQFTLSSAPSGCSYAVSPGKQSFEAAGGSAAVRIATKSNCAWRAQIGTSNVNWVKLTPASGTGDGTINLSVDPNMTALYRRATVNISGQNLLVEQAGNNGACRATPISKNQAVTGELNPGDCPSVASTDTQIYPADRYTFTALAGEQIAIEQSHVSFDILLINPSGAVIATSMYRLPGLGFFTIPANGTYTFEITGKGPLSAAISYTVEVKGAPLGCATLARPGLLNFEAGEASSAIEVVAGSGCLWNARLETAAPWVTINGASNGAGSGKVELKLAANTTNRYRTATLRVGQQAVTLNQAGANGSCSVTPVALGQTVNGKLTGGDCHAISPFGFTNRPADRYSFPGKAGDRVALSTNNTTNIQLISPEGRVLLDASRRLPLQGFYTLPADGLYRIEINSPTNDDLDYALTLEQAPGDCGFALSPGAMPYISGQGGKFSLDVLTEGDCPWMAQSQTFWLTLNTTGGKGPGKVEVTVASYSGFSPRSGLLVIGGVQYPVYQHTAGDCVAREVAIGQTLPRTFVGNGGCTSPLPTSGDPRRADHYSLEYAAGRQFAIEAASSGVTTILTIFDPDGKALLQGQRRLPGGAGFLALPSSGKYLIEITSDSPGGGGEYTLSLPAPTQCAISLLDSQPVFERQGGAGVAKIVAGTDCPWTARSNAAWIAIAPGASGRGVGDVKFDIAANVGTDLRTGTVTIGDQTLSVRQAGTTGNCAITPINANQRITGNLARGDCPARTLYVAGAFFGGQPRYADAFSFSGTAGDWLDIAPSGDNVVLFGPDGINLNPSFIAASGRRRWPWRLPATGTYLIEYSSNDAGNYDFAVVQNKATCGFSVTPPQKTSFDDAGGSLKIDVLAGGGCRWTARVLPRFSSAPPDWIKIESDLPVVGAGSVAFAIAPNNGDIWRTAEVTVAGQTFTISQAGKGGACSAPIPIKPFELIAGALSSANCSDTQYIFEGKSGEQVAVQLAGDWQFISTDLYRFGTSRSLGSTFSDRLPATGFVTLPEDGLYVISLRGRASVKFNYVISLYSSAAGCGYGLSDSIASFDSTGGQGSVSVITPGSCAWSSFSPVDWVKFDAGGAGTGAGPVTFTVAPNPGAASENATVFIAGQPLVVRRAGTSGSCVTQPIQSGQAVSGKIDESDCRLPAGSNTNIRTHTETYGFDGRAGDKALISVTGLTRGVVVLILSDGTRREQIVGTLITLPVDGRYVIQIGLNSSDFSTGQNFQLRLLLASSLCSYDVSPVKLTFGPAGGQRSISVSTSSDCGWFASSNASWITIGAGGQGSGDGAFDFTVAANTGDYRTGVINVAGRSIVVEQAGATQSCDPQPIAAGTAVTGSLSARNCPSRARGTTFEGRFVANFYSFSGKKGEQIKLTASPAQLLFALFDANGMLLALGEGSRLPATGYFILPADGNYVAEIASVSQTSYTLSLLTTGAGCDFAVSPTFGSFDPAGGTGSFTVNTRSTCAWAAIAYSSWITINSGASGMGDGAVKFTAAANTTANYRTGSVRIGSRIFTIEQAGTGGACLPRPIANGQTIAAEFSAGDCRSSYITRYEALADSYTYNGRAGDRIVVSIVPPLTQQITLSLVAPDGRLLLQTEGGRLPVGLGVVILPVNGTYIIETATFTQSAGSRYRINLQAVSACSFAVAPSIVFVPAGGGMADVAVNSATGCDWLASSETEWLTFMQAFGSGGSKASLLAAPNRSFAQRSGKVVIAGLSVTVVQAANSVHVSSASLVAGEVARESLVTAFGEGLATTTATPGSPLPVVAGTTVKVHDSLGVTRDALISFVSPAQINYLIPVAAAVGPATVLIAAGDGRMATANVTISHVAPSLFAANGDGKGVASGFALRVKADGTRTFEPIAQFDRASGRFVAVPIDAGTPGDQVFLAVLGTGFRFRSTLESVKAVIGGVETSVNFAGPQGAVAGMDQINILLPHSLAGRGEVDVSFSADGRTANRVRIAVK